VRAIAALAASALLAACGIDVVDLEGKTTTPRPKPECVSDPPGSAIQCVYCGADYSVQRACLKCEQPPDGMGCIKCVWSDQTPAPSCRQCTDASGAIFTVGCGRQDLMVPGT
jgi:hypothetical protein